MQYRGNDFQVGQKKVKQLMFAAVISCVVSLLAGNVNQIVQAFFLVATLLTLVWAFVIIYKYCKCPHCGKRVYLGVLAVQVCPKCHRNLYSGKKAKKNR